MSIITLDILSKAIANRVGINMDEAKKDAGFIMDVFGFQDRVIDNVLDPEDRQLFYILEEEGMLTTEREETTLYDGREWITYYWRLKKKTILKYAKDGNYCNRILASNEAVYDISHGGIYSSLRDNIWATRKRYNL